MKDHVRIHVGFQSVIRIRELDPHPRGPRLRLQFWVDERHLPFDRLIAKGSEGEGRPVPKNNGTDIPLRYLRNHPDCREIRDPVKLIPGHHALAANHLLFENSATGRRRPLDSTRHRTTPFNFADTRLGHAETTELLGGALYHRRLIGVVHIAGCLDRERVLELRLYQRRAVEAEKRLTSFDRLSCSIDMQFLDVPFRSKSHDRQLSLIRPDSAWRADWPNHASQLHLFGTHSAPPDSIQAHFDTIAVVLIIASINRDVIHPH